MKFCISWELCEHSVSFTQEKMTLKGVWTFHETIFSFAAVTHTIMTVLCSESTLLRQKNFGITLLYFTEVNPGEPYFT